tara:strand:- start:7047 stop:8072 length:1026 start_codon:yes stop_codon:yes gene_type:complete
MNDDDDRVSRLTGILRMQAHLLHGVADRLHAAHPDEAGAVINVALSEYGKWRGERLRDRHDSAGINPSPGNLVAHWDNGDFHVVRALEEGIYEISPAMARVSLGSDPFAQFLVSVGAEELADSYYDTVLKALVGAYDPGIDVTVDRKVNSWTVNWSMKEESSASDVLSVAELETSSLVRNGANLFGALYFFLGTEVTTQLGDAGEKLLRRAVRETARERGEALRREHIAAGLPINLESLMKNYDSPVEEAFEWAEGEIMTPERWHADCTYCPFYDVWGEVGGQKLGWLFDEELHPALYQAYHPGIQVKFVSNKNHGHAVCGFRFDIVEGAPAPEAILEVED